ncbi:DUF6011 domain-containing protein [Streptomyces sp. NPDC047315]|uniref:DUF6011 domain-containing protein n=1 Tax=Streptomyces sp. NPDC047315 TaxID=3155142 RepID=UPI0033C1A7EB
MTRCRVCGRHLHAPATAARGIGPTCARNTQQATPTASRLRSAPADHCTGQQPLFPDAGLGLTVPDRINRHVPRPAA